MSALVSAASAVHSRVLSQPTTQSLRGWYSGTGSAGAAWVAPGKASRERKAACSGAVMMNSVSGERRILPLGILIGELLAG
ncbi:hypothetical protein D9M71_689860 [compost metagenome]